MRESLRTFLAEDLGPAWRDVSVEALGLGGARRAIGKVKIKADGVVCGLPICEPLVRMVEEISQLKCRTEIRLLHDEGAEASSGTVVAELHGPVATLLVAERTLLNLLQRLSGVATMTRRFVRTIGQAKARLLDTRKTTPGLRDLEKYAVRTGGGVNHRFGLYDMVMLKDNHITAMGGDIRSAVEQARKRHGPSLKIEVETSTLEQVKEAVAAGANLIMLDNMPPAKLRECVAFVAGRIPLEASGGITLETIAEVAATGVDYISVGAVTHSAPALDISMKIALED